MRSRRAVNIPKTAASFFLAFVLFISLNTVVARAQVSDESFESLQLLLWLVVPLLIGFFAGLIIGSALRGLLAGAFGAVIFCFITVLMIYGTGYVVVEYDLFAGTRTEFTAFQAFVYAMFSHGGIISGAISGIVGGWLGKYASKRPVTQRPEILFFCPQCGRRVPPFVEFCPYDGKSLGEKIQIELSLEKRKGFLKECPKCGKEIPIASEECRYCGARQQRAR